MHLPFIVNAREGIPPLVREQNNAMEVKTMKNTFTFNGQEFTGARDIMAYYREERAFILNQLENDAENLSRALRVSWDEQKEAVNAHLAWKKRQELRDNAMEDYNERLSFAKETEEEDEE
jgi:hypothetical protein